MGVAVKLKYWTLISPFNQKAFLMIKENPIKYANCWEDADNLLEALSPKEGSNILSIGSGGDNSLALLSTNPNKLTIVDYNIYQTYLIELKIAAFQVLEYDDLKRFLGFEPHKNRSAYYQKLKYLLSENGQSFWNANQNKIDQGLIFSGKFENYFRIFRKWILPFVASKNNINKFFDGTQSKKQKARYAKRIDNFAIKGLLKIYFSKKIMGKLGRSKKHFSHVDENISGFLVHEMREFILNDQSHVNGYIRFIATGSFGKYLPYFMRKENYLSIKSNLQKVEIKHGIAEDVLDKNMVYNSFNLSNIFEYMSIPEFKSIAETLKKHSKPGALFTYWNLFVSRELSHIMPEDFLQNEKLSSTLHEKDKLFFYKNFVVELRK